MGFASNLQRKLKLALFI